LGEQILEASMNSAELEAQHLVRRERVAKDAAAHIARFEAMSDDDKQHALHDGDLDHYSHENQLKREQMFDDDPEIGKVSVCSVGGRM
jgi:hypothetical protein